MAKFGINDILNAKTKAAGQQAQGYKEIYLSPYEVKAAEENTHQKLEGIEELADSFLHVGQEQPTVLANGYTTFTGTLPVVLEIHKTDNNGGIGWTYGNVYIKNGLITSIPQ